jgi:hypothetical protein
MFDCRKETAIAADLGIARRTVRTHLERPYRKLAVTTRVALMLRVMEAVLQARIKPETGAWQGAARHDSFYFKWLVSGEHPTPTIRLDCGKKQLVKTANSGLGAAGGIFAAGWQRKPGWRVCVCGQG